MTAMDKPGRPPVTTHDWESLLDGSHSAPLPRDLLIAALAAVLRRDFPLRHHLLVFLEERADVLFPDAPALAALLETARTLVHTPDFPSSAREQAISAATAVFIAADGLIIAPRETGQLVELLLALFNRPNHGPDRQTRAAAGECLRQLEMAHPRLLAETAPHLWSLCQSERTHAIQSYMLLLTTVVHSIVKFKLGVSIVSTKIPLIPFNIPNSLLASDNADNWGGKDLNLKELRKVVAFLLEIAHVLTPCGMVEFMGMMVDVALALELQPSILKVQFSSLLHSYDPMLCHVVLTLYSRFPDAFDGHETDIARRLVLMSKECQQPLVIRLLALHWLLGLPVKEDSVKKKIICKLWSHYYPSLFDPLALKALKLGLIAYVANSGESLKSASSAVEGDDSKLSGDKLFKDGLVSVSGFSYLPPWSGETIVAFWALHKLLVGVVPHSESGSPRTVNIMDSTIFLMVQNFLVDTSLEFPRLVPVIVSFIDRFLKCDFHSWFGERLLQKMDERLLPKLGSSNQLFSYFPVFYMIAQNESIPPATLLELLTVYVVSIAKSHGPDSGLIEWSNGSKILGVCRTMLKHHRSSRIFVRLSRLLSFMCLFFPDLEIRDNARIYLRMLLCVPGRKLRHLLDQGEQHPGVSSSPHLGSFFQVQSPRLSRDLKKSRDISSYIHIERVVPLLVDEPWSLVAANIIVEESNPQSPQITKGGHSVNFEGMVSEVGSASQVASVEEHSHTEPLRVMDTRFSEITGVLRRHFTGIPDFKCMPGVKIRILCTLRFESEPFNRVWGVDKTSVASGELDELPALYATVICFSSLNPYGSIPKFRIPFLLGEPSPSNDSFDDREGLDIVLAENGSQEDGESLKARVEIELEPRDPMPGLISVSIEANADNGQIIQGPLQSIKVGIEDMFLNVNLPSDVVADMKAEYLSDLFSALWEACGSASSIGREVLSLKGGKGVAINGTQSVKMMEVPDAVVIRRVESHLAPFVVSVNGQPLVDMVKDNGVINNVVWSEQPLDSRPIGSSSAQYLDKNPLLLKDVAGANDDENFSRITKKMLGCFLILIFLPPRFHLLLRLEVGNISTLVRIRTDHWQCLAYIDDYLEALFLS